MIVAQVAASTPSDSIYSSNALRGVIARAAEANRIVPPTLASYRAHVESEMALILVDTLGRERTGQGRDGGGRQFGDTCPGDSCCRAGGGGQETRATSRRHGVSVGRGPRRTPGLGDWNWYTPRDLNPEPTD